MLDLIIAIFLIYALFAGLISGINELVTQSLEMRGRVLFESIAMMLGELPPATGIRKWTNPVLRRFGFDTTINAEYTKKLYEHPLINTLSQSGCSRPSYISSSSFSSAFVQALSDNSLPALRQKLEDRTKPLGQLFGPMLDEANGDLEKFKAKLENHFNLVMNRVEGWYKRRSQAMMGIIGLVLAVLLNVDSIYIVQQLQRNPEQVAKLVQVAENELEAVKVQHSEAKNQTVNAAAQSSVNSEMKQDNNASEKEGPENAINQSISAEKVEKLFQQFDEFKNSGLPIGWVYSDQKTEQSLNPFHYLDYPILQNQALSPFGWFLTALAGMLGAPFWFDSISKLFSLRGTGKKPEESSVTSDTSSAPAVQFVVPPVNSPEQTSHAPLSDFEASRLNSEDIEGLQRALGIPDKRINGKLNEELRNALCEWQRITGQTVTGRFDEPTVLALLYSKTKGD